MNVISFDIEKFTLTKRPKPTNFCFATTAKTTTTTVDIKRTAIASNMRWPNHKPTGLFNPFENCMAWTDERRSFDTYKVKKAGYTAYE